MTYIIKDIDFDTFKYRNVDGSLNNKSNVFTIVKEDYKNNKEYFDFQINSIVDKPLPTPALHKIISFSIKDINIKTLYELELKVVKVENDMISLVLLQVK